jgi:hypothetical protein
MLARARDDYGSWLMNRVWRLRHRCFFAGFCTHTWLSASMVVPQVRARVTSYVTSSPSEDGCSPRASRGTSGVARFLLRLALP